MRIKTDLLFIYHLLSKLDIQRFIDTETHMETDDQKNAAARDTDRRDQHPPPIRCDIPEDQTGIKARFFSVGFFRGFFLSFWQFVLHQLARGLSEEMMACPNNRCRRK